MTGQTLDLYGGERPWDAALWETSDDRVRGGSSQSYFTVVDPGHARFSGHLDTKTLGGAGFASQHTIGELELDLSPYLGLVICVAADPAASFGTEGGDKSKPKRWAVTLKDDLPGKRPDGRERSGISWEADFTWGPRDGGAEFFLPWSQFKATYRGRDKPDADPLNLAGIKRIGLMMRSFFEEQDGDFQIDLQAIRARKTTHHDSMGSKDDATRTGGADRDADRDDETLGHEDEDEDEDDLAAQKHKAATQHDHHQLGQNPDSHATPLWKRLLCGFL
jgi:hypothetical protein